jgi:hypothetical protein
MSEEQAPVEIDLSSIPSEAPPPVVELPPPPKPKRTRKSIKAIPEGEELKQKRVHIMTEKRKEAFRRCQEGRMRKLEEKRRAKELAAAQLETPIACCAS